MCYLNSRIFNPHDFTVNDDDFLNLNSLRPFGLSGHLRVRNEAITLRSCLDSCLPFLDELIVTYNDSSDETEDILFEYLERYPNKIRLFWYPLEWGNIRGRVQARPLGHLAQFYNFGYVKIQYSHYIKIDGDQVYFTEKFLFIKEMIQKYSNPNLSLADIPDFQDGQSSIYEYCERNIARTLINHKQYAFIFGGLNSCYCNYDLYASTFRNLDEKTIFNGFCGDAFIICPNFKQRYFLLDDFIEFFPHTNSKCVSLGLGWIHANIAKQNHHYKRGPVIPLKIAHSLSWNEVYAKINPNPTTDIKTHNFYKNLGRRFWDKDIPEFLTKEFYNKFLKTLLPAISKKIPE